MLATNVTAALQLAKALGFDEVEAPGFYRQSPITFRALLDQNGLKCTALVAPYEVLRDDIEGVSRDASVIAGALGEHGVVKIYATGDLAGKLPGVAVSAAMQAARSPSLDGSST